jgi:hypothetical protein
LETLIETKKPWKSWVPFTIDPKTLAILGNQMEILGFGLEKSRKLILEDCMRRQMGVIMSTDCNGDAMAHLILH